MLTCVIKLLSNNPPPLTIGLKILPLIISQFWSQNSRNSIDQLIFCFRFHKAKKKKKYWKASLIFGALKSESIFKLIQVVKTSVLCGCVTDVPISFHAADSEVLRGFFSLASNTVEFESSVLNNPYLPFCPIFSLFYSATSLYGLFCFLFCS